MAQICETCKKKNDRCYCPPNSTCMAYEEDKQTEKSLLERLVDLYINDTADCEGLLFCGCREEDCENYRTEECRECLLRYLKERENN